MITDTHFTYMFPTYCTQMKWWNAMPMFALTLCACVHRDVHWSALEKDYCGDYTWQRISMVTLTDLQMIEIQPQRLSLAHSLVCLPPPCTYTGAWMSTAMFTIVIANFVMILYLLVSMLKLICDGILSLFFLFVLFMTVDSSLQIHTESVLLVCDT